MNFLIFVVLFIRGRSYNKNCLWDVVFRRQARFGNVTKRMEVVRENRERSRRSRPSSVVNFDDFELDDDDDEGLQLEPDDDDGWD